MKQRSSTQNQNAYLSNAKAAPRLPRTLRSRKRTATKRRLHHAETLASWRSSGTSGLWPKAFDENAASRTTMAKPIITQALRKSTGRRRARRREEAHQEGQEERGDFEQRRIQVPVLDVERELPRHPGTADVDDD